jgi:hypothetical protein
VVGLLLALVGLLGYFAVVASSGGTHIGGMWPIGLATGLLVFVTGRVAILGYAEAEVLGQPEMFDSPTEIARHAASLGVPADLVHVGLALSDPGTGPQERRGAVRLDVLGLDRRPPGHGRRLPDHRRVPLTGPRTPS